MDRTKEFDNLSKTVIGCAIEVHKSLGPGLLEATYHKCLEHELALAGLHFLSEKPVSLQYKTVNLDCGFRLDLIVQDSLIIEIKSVEQFLPIHQAQVLTYMKITNIQTALLLNFNVPILKHGIKRFVNQKTSRNSAPASRNFAL